jgi:ADP-ribose pyrophosphatase
MVRQFRLAAGKALLEIPAGTLEPGEEPLACALRELEEETGFSARQMDPLFAAYLAPGYSTELIHAYLAVGLFKPERPAAQDVDENIALERIPLAEVERMILAGELQDSKSIASILTAVRVLENR